MGMFDLISEDHVVLNIFSFVCGVEAMTMKENSSGDGLMLVNMSSRGVLRLVCRDFNRIINLILESIRLPCSALQDIFKSSTDPFQWTTICPKLNRIQIDCSSVAESQCIMDILQCDVRFPFWELFSNTPVKFSSSAEYLNELPTTNKNIRAQSSIPYCYKSYKQVGFQINYHLSPKAVDGHVILQGILHCVNGTCGRDLVSNSLLYIRHLNVSEANISDDSLEACYPLLRLVEIIDLRRCHLLKHPFPSTAVDMLTNLEKILVDGCWEIDESHLLQFEQAFCAHQSDAERTIHIDLLHECFVPPMDAEVVILAESHRGAWVRCTVTRRNKNLSMSLNSEFNGASSTSEKQTTLYTSYNVFVWETLKFDHAAGFSNFPAYDIARKHLRHGNIC